MTRIILLLGVLTATVQLGYSQASKMKFGKINKADLDMKVYDKDTSASAVVLGDYTYTRFMYSGDKGFEFIMTRHVRIKIFDKNGHEFANKSVPFYSEQKGGTSESLGTLKGLTYNLDGNSIVKTKMDKSDIFEEQSNPYWKQKKFTLPNVTEGSVIEYKYTVKSPYVRQLRDWEFQYDIPVISIEYDVTIPEQLNYQVQQEGYARLSKNDLQYKSEEFSYTYQVVVAGANNDSGKREVTFDSQSKVYSFAAEDVPAFKVEPLMTSKYDYLGKMTFEIKSIRWPNQAPKELSTTWNALSKNLLESSSFGSQLKNTGYLKKITEPLVSGAQSDTEKIDLICNYLKSNMAYNGMNGKYSSSIKKALDEKKGSSQEINLSLVAMLRHAGIQADPVILSTRDHGFIREFFPTLEQVNYVICKATLPDGYILLDATDSYLSNGLIPEKCLNGKGYIVSEDSPGWVALKPSTKKSVKLSAQIEITDDGEMIGSFKKDYNGYLARDKRKSILSQGEDSYKDDMMEDSPWEIDEIEFIELKNKGAALTTKYTWESEEGAENMGGTIYLSPMLDLKMSENIFKSETRDYPVDYGCPEEQTYYAQFTLPTGYSIAEKPENTAMALPDKGGRFIYQISANGNIVTIMSKLNINKSLFIQNEYPALKQFYAAIVAKHAEQIVLKKT